MSNSTPSTEVTTNLVPQLSLNSRRRIMQAAFYTPQKEGDGSIRWNHPVMFTGGPGTAKTSVTRQVIRYSGFKAYRILTPGTNGEGEFGVFPCPAADGFLDHPSPRWAQMFAATGLGQGCGVVVVDEATTADEVVQKPIMGLILDGLIGDNDLGARVRRVALANPVEMATGGHPLAPPLANRLIHLPWDCPTEDDMRMERFNPEGLRVIENPAAEEARVLSLWDDAYAVADASVLQFLRTMPQYVYVPPTPDSAASSAAFPTPRSWSMVKQSIATARVHKLTPEETAALVVGCVGPGVGSEFLAYEDVHDLPSPRDILEGRVTFDVRKVLPDRAYAISTAIGAYVCSLPRDTEASDRLTIAAWGLMGEIAATGKVDVARAAVQPMTMPPGLRHVSKGPLAKEVRNASMPVMHAVHSSGVELDKV